MEILSDLSSWVLPSILVVSISFIYVFSLRSNKYSKATSNPPPNPPKLPVIGNLHQLVGEHRHQTLWELSQKYGPVMLLHIGVKPMLIISSSSMAKEVLKTKDHKFCSRILSPATNRLSYNYMDVAFSPYSSHWREMRKILVSEFLGPKRAALFHQALALEVESVIRSLSSHSSNDVVNAEDMLLGIVQGAVCKVAFGRNYGEPVEGVSWKVMLDEGMVMLNGSVGAYFPLFGPLVDRVRGWKNRLDKFCSNLDRYIEDILSEHLGQNVAEIADSEKDFVHSLIEMSTKEESRLTKDEMKALLMDIIMGAIDSTFVTMVWAMSEIVRNSRVLRKLQSEIRTCNNNLEKPQQLDITNMTNLKMAVSEALRLHPPAPLLIPHDCLDDCQIGGYDVFKGTTILINAWAIGRDKSIWGENSSEFYPERFESREIDFGTKGSYEMMPFGGGRRSCPAMTTAPATIEFTIGNLLYWYDWIVPDGVKNEDLDMTNEGFPILRKKTPLLLIPIKHDVGNVEKK